MSPLTSTDKRMSICSQEVSKLSDKQIGYISVMEIVDDRPASPVPFKREPFDPKLLRTVKETAMSHVSGKVEIKKQSGIITAKSESPRTLVAKVEFDRPHEIKSLLVDAAIIRPLSPVQVIVFPPELPDMLPIRPKSPMKKSKDGKISPSKHLKNGLDGRRSKSPKPKKTKQKTSEVKTEMSVSVKREVDKFETVKQNEKTATTIRDLPKPIVESGLMASALATAPTKPFRPKVVTERALVPIGKVGLPPDSEPYFPPEHGSKDDRVAQAMREVRCKSPMTDMLTTASPRPYSPLPPATKAAAFSTTSTYTSSSVSTAGFQPVRKPVSMLTALTVAPTVPFTVPGKTPVPTDALPVPSAFKPVSASSPTFVPVPGRPHSPMKYYPAYTRIPQPSPPPEIARGEFTDKDHIHYETTMKPPSPKPKTSIVISESITTTGKTDTLKTKQTSKSTESETFLLPYYQQNIGEIPVRNRSISPIRQIKAPSYSPSEQVLHPPPSVKQMSQTKTLTAKPQDQHYQDPHSKQQFNLHAPNLLPYYQQNIGEIPVRNKSISPVPHPIKAPSFDPKSMTPPPVNLCYSSSSTVPAYGYKPSPHVVKSIQTQTEIPQIKQIKEVIRESLSEESRNLSKHEKEVYKSVTKITQGVLRPASPSTWKANVNKQVQNLSPITVRIPSPVPKPLGHTRESVGSNVHITHHRDHTSSVSVTPIPDETHTFQESRGKPRGQTSPGVTKLSTTAKSSTQKSTSSKQTSQAGQSSGTITQQTAYITGKTCPLQVSSYIVPQQTKVYHEQKQISNVSDMHTYSGEKQVTKSVHSIVGDKETINKHSNANGITGRGHHTEKYSGSGLTSKSLSSEKVMANNHVATTPSGNSVKIFSQTGNSVLSTQSKSFTSGKHTSGGVQSTTKTIMTSSSDKSGGSGRIPSKSLLPSVSGLSGGNGTGGGAGAGGKGAVTGATTAPKRGRGVLNPNVGPQARIPLCGHCNKQIRGPFITALGKIWCPEHFICVNAQCHRPLQDIGFVEEQEGLYCEYCFEKYLAPNCSKCNSKIKGDCLNAIGKQFHPECFSCTYCGKVFGNNPFFLEDSLPYCEADWNELFTTKCFSCGFPIEAGDRWVEALSNNYHSQCFNCTMCKKNLEGQSFFAKGGRPFCKNHAR